MTVPRIIFGGRLADGALVTIDGENHHYLARVLRVKPGERFDGVDAAGREFLCEIVAVTAHEMQAYVFGKHAMDAPPVRPLSLVFGLLKGEKNELLLKFGTQVGVTAFHPCIMERTVLRLDKDKLASRVERFRRVVDDAARTSFITYVPSVEASAIAPPPPFPDGTVKLLFSERKGIRPLRELEREIAQSGGAAAVFGPEGGFEDVEHDALEAAGFVPVSLGDRALKAETAVLSGLAIITYLRGNLRD